jgi:glycosyltransferase involved in cell wall biosynthesis
MSRILLLYDAFIPSVRLCAYEQLKYLYGLGKIEFQHSDIKKVTSQQCKDADVVILVRASTLLEHKLYKKFIKDKKFLIYVIDDDLLSIGSKLESTKYYSMPNIKSRISYMIDHCNILVSPSELLLYKYGKNKRTCKIEEPCYFANNEKNNNKLKIGFAGSIDHKEEINILLHNAIKAIIYKYNNQVEFEFIGAKPDIVNELNIKHYDYLHNYSDYQKLMEELNWDIGLAPLADSEFNRGKYYNKYIEYGSVACVGIYSWVKPYTEVIVDNYNGYLCENTEEAWTEKLAYIIEHRNEINTIREQVSNHILNNFGVDIISKKFLKEIPELIQYTAQKRGYYPLKLYKLYCLFFRGIEFWGRNGFKSVFIVLTKIRKHLRKT